MAEHVVEDVRLGQVIELLALPDGDRRRKLSERQALKKSLRRYVSRYRHRLPASGGSEPAIHFGQVGYGLALESDRVRALEEDPAPVAAKLLHPPLVEQAPDVVIIGSVG